MQPYEKITEYCNKVCEQIRWKKAKPLIATEIENHLCDQRNAYMSNGDDEITATQKAILQMGDAISVGQQLDKTHKPKPQWVLLGFVGAFMAIGAIINFYLKDITDINNNFSVVSYILAFGIVVLFYNIDFTFLGKHSKKIYGFVLIASIIAAMLAPNINGRAVLTVRGFSMPLSYLSLIFTLAFALLIYSMRNKGMIGVLISGAAYLPFAAILLSVPSLTGFMLYSTVALIVLCFAICRGWYGIDKKQGVLFVMLPTLIISLLLIATLVINNPHRLSIFLNPEQNSSGAGYVYSVLRNILSEAVLFGEGNAIDIMGYLPFISVDYPFVYLIHQFGFVTLLGIVLLVMIFTVLGIRKALKEKSVLGGVIALTIILTFAVQAFSYVIDNLGYGLISSLSLPFISFGSASLFINAVLIGFMLSVFRTGEIFKDCSTIAQTHNNSGSQPMFSYENGKLIININPNHS